MSEKKSGVDRPIVLVALDGSAEAARALPVARIIAARMGASVEALHVLAKNAVDRATPLGAEGGVDQRIPLRVVRGDPVDEILRAGADPQVALVVLTTHGRRTPRAGGVATVARRVAAETMQPVLLVRPEAVTPPRELVGRLLVPMDGTPTTAAALAPAAGLAAKLRANIDVLFVVHPGQVLPEERGTMTVPYYVDQPHYEWPAWRDRVDRWLRCHCEGLPDDAVIHAHVRSARTHVEIGKAIASFAAERGEDAIILVRRSHLAAGRGQILRAVLQHAPCPVMMLAGEPVATQLLQAFKPASAAMASRPPLSPTGTEG